MSQPPELRRPPTADPPRPGRGLLTALVAATLLLVAGLGALVWLRPPGGAAAGAEALERRREVAAKLQAAGLLDESARLWAGYLEDGGGAGEARARIAYSVGGSFLEAGRCEPALRWFYEAESLGAGSLGDELSAKIVHCLERLGRHHAAEAAMGSRVALAPAAGGGEDDPLVARIGADEIRRSQLVQALDRLGERGAAGALGDPERGGELLRRYVAEELLWRKARKLELDDDPEVREQHAAALKQLAVAALVERELISGMSVDEADLRTFFEANRERYAEQAGDGQQPGFERLRPLVERDYRLMKLEAGYQQMIESELAAAGVELYPENLAGGG